MPLPGEARVGAPFAPPATVLQQARERERAGCIPEAIDRYGAAISAADRYGDHGVLRDALTVPVGVVVARFDRLPPFAHQGQV